uniref:KIB1-4 beta-propeller domain-containing protein n=1 Tax=Arundo donax TaxID=35708 RepID=A0A0A8XRN3_ARUDO
MMVAMRSVNGALYALLNTCQLAVAELLDNKVELKLLGGEVDEHVRDAWMESKDFILGECAGDPLLIFKFKVSVNPAYKVFRWEPGEERWVRVRSLRRRTLFMSINGFDAWLIPDSPGVRGDCIYEALPRAADWSEYSLVDGTCELVTIEYQGAPGVDAARTQVWVLPSFF